MFKVGDRVACVYDFTSLNSLIKNKIYTITKIDKNYTSLNNNNNNEFFVNILETKTWYDSKRFISLQEYRRFKLNQLNKCSK